ncbi:MAG: chloride channel protein [Arcticibacter sp.]
MYSKLLTLVQNLNRYRKQHVSNRNFLIIAAVIVGIIAGLAASVLKLLTHHIEVFLQDELQWKYKIYLYLGFPLLGMLLSTIYVKRFIVKRKFETGLTQILYSISRKSSKMDFHNIYSQIITSALTVGFGGSTGLEAPIATSGASIGSNIGRVLGLNYREVTLLLACGSAAAIAGAFNSPLAGIVFAIEILLPEFSIPVFIPLLIASATASVVARLFYQEQLFLFISEGWEFKGLAFYVLLAILLGLFSIFFTKLTYWVKGKFKKIENVYSRAIVGGLILGLLIFIFPTLYGEGYISIKQLLVGNYNILLRNSIFSQYTDVPAILIFFTLFALFAKAFATLVTLSAGGNGGVFGPSIILGGLAGFLFSYGINQTGLIQLNISNFIVAGMAAALSGIMHAPLTGIFLIAEITGGYVLMVPLMIVSAISYFISKASLKHSIYTKALAEKGELLSHEDKDGIVLRMMKLKYLIEKGFVELHPDETPQQRSADILQSKRNIFPVVDKNRKFLGLIYSGALFDLLVNKKDDVRISELYEQAPAVVYSTESMQAVMEKMDKQDVWILPVVNAEGEYLGFISKSAVFNKYRSLLVRQAAYLD